MTFFGWLTSLVRPLARQRATEIRRLEEERDKVVAQTRQAALAGDQDATIRLREYNKTLAHQSEQTIRNAAKQAD